MPLRHPLDVQDDERDRERMLRQNRLSDGFRRSDNLAGRAEGAEEVCPESLEEVDVFRFLAGEIQKCSNARIVAVQDGPRVIQNEGQNELLHEAKYVEVVVSTDLIQDHTLLGRQKVQRFDARQR